MKHNKRASILFAVVGLLWLCIGIPLGAEVCDRPAPGPAPTPTPMSTPLPVVPTPTPDPADSGWHRAIDVEGNEYQIDLPYALMNDWQRGDANRFAREYPDGE